MAAALFADWGETSLMAAMETEMLAGPGYWQSYYRGGPDRQRLLRHYSYSDRIRYYWSAPGAQLAVQRLLDRLGEVDIPEPLISQFLPTLCGRVTSGEIGSGPVTWRWRSFATYSVAIPRRADDEIGRPG